MSYFQPGGSFNSLLKEGFRHFKGENEVVMKTIDAVGDLSSMTRTALGPNGMNKYIVNMHDKLFLTKDTSVMVGELDINHPSVKIVVEAGKSQDKEYGDGTNFTITLSGELLRLAGELLTTGVHLSDVIVGYQKGLEKSLKIIDEAPKLDIKDALTKEKASKIIESVIGTKLIHGQEKYLAPLIAQACCEVLPKNKNEFKVDNVRCAKILGGSILNSQTIQGLVVVRNVEGNITKAEKCNVALYNCALETQSAETTDEVVFKNADDLLNYTVGEENQMEKKIKDIVDSGVKAVICMGAISNMAIHFLDKYGILAFRVMSKFEFMRLAKTLGATPLVHTVPPTKEEMGYADIIEVTEISSTKCILVKRESENNKLSTIIIRGTTNDILDNLEKVVEDGVNAYMAACRSNIYIPGAGATEMFIANKVKEFSKSVSTLDQYGIEKFGEAFEVVPRTIIENSGFNVNETLPLLRTKNLENPKNGIDIKSGEIVDVLEKEIYDHLDAKKMAIRFAVDACLTLLQVDQLIVAKPAGGPNLSKKPPGYENDEQQAY